MRIGEFCGHVEAEVGIIVDVGVAETNEQTSARHVGLSQQNGLESRINGLAEILEQNWHAYAYAVLERAQERAVREFDYFETILALLVAYPTVGLLLRVDHQRPATTARHQDGVLGREVVSRQTVRVPLSTKNEKNKIIINIF